MGVKGADGFEEGGHGGGADVAEAVLLHRLEDLLTHCVIGVTLLFGVIDQVPEVISEGLAIFQAVKKDLGIVNNGLDLAPVADKPAVLEQALVFIAVIAGDLAVVEAIIGRIEVIRLLKDGLPGQATLHDFQAQGFEEGLVILSRSAPNLVVVGNKFGRRGPAAACCHLFASSFPFALLPL